MKSTPVIILNSSPARCCVVPLPDEPWLILSGICLRVGDEFAEPSSPEKMLRPSSTLGNRTTPATGATSSDEIEAELFVERRIDGVHCAAEQQRVTVGGRTNDRFGRDVAARAGPVLDNDRLVELLRQPLADQARNDVEVAARRKADQDTHRPRRIGLRRCAPCGIVGRAAAPAASCRNLRRGIFMSVSLRCRRPHQLAAARPQSISS